MKKTILHFIYDLGRGGAETMMVRVIKELAEYDHIVVTLYPYNRLADELQCKKFICLNQRSLLFFPFTAITLRKLVKRYNVDIVHTHLFWPTVIARLGTPKKNPLITTIHSFIATSVEYKNWYIRCLDRWSYRFRKSVIIAVAKGAMQEYFSFLKLKPYKAHALYTFVDINHFKLPVNIPPRTADKFSIVCVGALRLQKNHSYLIEAFKKLKNENIELDIYGVGPLQEQLQKAIDNEPGIKLVLKGEVSNISELLPQYDLYVMSSSFEGFSLSVLEAMAMKMPLLLSDISSFKEQCDDIAIYFDLHDVNDFIQKLHLLMADKAQLNNMGSAGYQKAVDHYTLPKHIAGLRKIYTDALNDI